MNRISVKEYDITRIGLNLDINWTCAQIVKSLDKYEYRDLIVWLITQTERIYLKALESNQFSAAMEVKLNAPNNDRS